MKIIKTNFNASNTPVDKTLQKLLAQGFDVKENEGAKYSEMLINVIKPFLNPMPYPDELEEMLELGIIGWNMGNVESTGYPGFKKMLDDFLKSNIVTKEGKAIVKKIILAKQQQYPEHLNFIKDYELIEDNDGMININIISQSFADFLNDDADELQELEDMQFEKGFINRNALLIKPRQLFWDWLKKADKDFEQPEFAEKVIYLINEKDSEEETTAWLKKNFDKIFVAELEGWTESKKQWPKKRNYQMFTEFFEVEYHSMLMDLEKEPVTKD